MIAGAAISVALAICITYYYDWCGQPSHAFRPEEALDGQSTYGTRVIGQTTGTKIKVLGIPETRYLTTAVYFDSDYQTIQSVADLYNAGTFGTEVVSNAHDFLGTVTDTKVKQSVSSTVTEYTKVFAHDNQGRLRNVKMKVTGDNANNQVTLASYTYNELGQTTTKSIHNGAEETTYTYDLQGRTIGSESPSFSWWLDFDKNTTGLANGSRYDGNIQTAIWQHAGEAKRAYYYAYNALGQITSGAYRQKGTLQNPNGTWSTTNAYKESYIYDKSGSGNGNGADNITSMNRCDKDGVLTSIILGYTGYRLKDVKINGVTTQYAYDANGNLTFDARVGNTIEYNLLNLPLKVSNGSDYISYVYSASGEKLASDAKGSLTYYRSVMIYDGSNSLSVIFQPEGTISKTGTTYTYNYFKTDHVGSTRAMLSALGNTLVENQRTDFYPFGLAWEYSNLHLNKYLFNGKEIQDASINGSLLGIYDYGARYYDPVIGRWFTHDPKLQFANPYMFCANSPGMYIDPDGQILWFIPVIIGAVVGGATNAIVHRKDIGNFWDGLKHFGIGAAVGAASGAAAFGGGALVSGLFATQAQAGALFGMAVGAGSGVAGGFVGGAGLAAAYGAPISKVLMAGLQGAAVGGIGGAIVGGATEGIRALANKSNFWSGKPNQLSPQPVGTELPKSSLDSPEPNNARVDGAQKNPTPTPPETPTPQTDPAKLLKEHIEYPPNNGFEGVPQDGHLMPGDKVIRYGTDPGQFVAPEGTPPAQLSLPPSTNPNVINKFEILKPIPMHHGPASPAFMQPGGGTQYYLPKPTDMLQDLKYIKPAR